VEACDAVYLETARADAERFATRIFGNALTNHPWRNASVEEIHAGAVRGTLSNQRRITPAEERELMGFAGE
jgi:hypothetical protein